MKAVGRKPLRGLLTAGVDEAGRGPLAGPVVAAAVILDPGRAPPAVRDSKVLAPERRLVLALEVKACAVAWAVGRAEVEEIDHLNILQATMLAMARAVAALGRVPGHVLVDGDRVPPGLPCPARAVIRGDATVAAISAASILAKTHRDAEMEALEATFPQYGFARHKGYGTPQHLLALQRFGPCGIHRRSFAPVKALLGVEGAIEDEGPCR